MSSSESDLNESELLENGYVSPMNRPVLMDNDLCDFLKVKYGSKLVRTDITIGITEYIKKHDLQNINDGIVDVDRDQNLQKLLGDLEFRKALVSNAKTKNPPNLHQLFSTNVSFSNLIFYLDRHIKKK